MKFQPIISVGTFLKIAGKQVLKRVKHSQQQVSRLTTIWVDGGFDGEPFMQWVMDVCRWIVQMVLRSQETKGFILLCYCYLILIGSNVHISALAVTVTSSTGLMRSP
ncbi:MAG: hypothetical protein V7K71_16015 [Nostoc sp.]